MNSMFIQPNSTKSRREAALQYYKNLQKQRKGNISQFKQLMLARYPFCYTESSQRELSQTTLNHLYVNTEARGCINEVRVSDDLPSSAAVDAEVKGQEYKTQCVEMMIKDGEAIAP